MFSADNLRMFFTGLNKLVRPYLTFFIATMYNVLLGYFALSAKITPQEYITSVGPTNAMLIGFWFGEKGALKQAGELDDK